MQENSGDTKSLIFYTSMRLFALEGYENVSVRQIADTVGIKAASIYNHYSTKEEILDACYDFFPKYRHITRLEKEEYQPIIKEGTKEEILNVLNYTYPESIIENIIYSLLIIFSRIYNDKKAKELYVDEINSSMQYLSDFFNYGINIGRFHTFDVQAVSLLFLSSRLFTAQSVTISPEQKSVWRKSELDIYNELLKLISFKY